ncbi:ATP phosphoribosyltransferase regulatory subunit [Propionispora sp. 2/2-37]|uniref:ATP phosphoribosyltransferase regulatory subunit n=1 Tax=Propionispora sp. 2/2-37 TaxID=1677858 RepID=UPI0006C01A38|nr:ATP phosphoribosyltransferase regulatory subunit [Propionispora sp. 2/2-37]CUH96333.1 ATP phosphoribosyltransferase regulatory subunit [Propionispora sp. 2/2-37]
MKKNEFVPQIPYGTRDFLPREAKYKRSVESALAALFAKWGYDEVITPTFEYLETLAAGTGDSMDQNMFKFFDKDNHILALRPDMTTPISRVASTRLKENSLPLRLFYLTNVFRYEQAQAGRQCEFYQAGVELLGVPGPAADAEVIALAVQSMLDAGLSNFQISIGQVEFINGIMDESRLSLDQRQEVKYCMVARNLVGLGEILAASGLAGEVQDLLRQIPLLYGREELLEKAYAMVKNPVSRMALDNLSDIYRLLKSYGVQQYVNFDLGIIRDFSYYTGMVFEGYTPGLGFPVCGGGRYDHMLSSFGVECPSTGFALGIERILLALERQGICIPADFRECYVGWREGKLQEAIAEAAKLRHSGRSVELALIAQSREEAEEKQLKHGCKQLIYIE